MYSLTKVEVEGVARRLSISINEIESIADELETSKPSTSVRFALDKMNDLLTELKVLHFDLKQ